MGSLKRSIFERVLKPIILKDYALRQAGQRPDQWHWADRLALSWGYGVNPDDEAAKPK